MTKYLLKANTKSEGILYFMNVICVTGQPECAMYYRTEEDAKKDIQLFENLLQNTEHDGIEVVDKDYEIVAKDTASNFA